jgi:hypothetical protein
MFLNHVPLLKMYLTGKRKQRSAVPLFTAKLAPGSALFNCIYTILYYILYVSESNALQVSVILQKRFPRDPCSYSFVTV